MTEAQIIFAQVAMQELSKVGVAIASSNMNSAEYKISSVIDIMAMLVKDVMPETEED